MILPIPIHRGRLEKALRKVRGDFRIRGRHPLNIAFVLRITEQMNAIRTDNIEFHSALQQAAELETDAQTGLKALARKVVARYGQLTYQALKDAGIPTGELAFWRGAFAEPPQKNGAQARIARTREASGQYGFLSERRSRCIR